MINKEKIVCEFHSLYLYRISIGICYDYVHVTQSQLILVREVTIDSSITYCIEKINSVGQHHTLLHGLHYP